jgi:hypothetical protein
MRLATTSTRLRTRPVVFRFVFGLALLALAVGVLPVQRAAASGPSIAAWTEFTPPSSQTVTVQGSGFTPGGTVEVWIYDEDRRAWDVRYVTATPTTYVEECVSGSYFFCYWRELHGGRIDVTFPIYCPHWISVYAADHATGAKATLRFYGPLCPD